MKNITLVFIAFLFTLNSSGQWVQKSPLSETARYAAVAFSIDGKGYAGLGETNDSLMLYDFWEYDPATDIWTQKNLFPGHGSYSASAFVINGKGYICFGADQQINCYGELWEYTPETDTWVQKSSFPGQGRYGASCFVIGDTAYIGTGSYNNGYDYLYDMWKYVPATDTWTRIADFPGLNRNHSTAYTLEGFGYLGTGLDYTNAASNDLWKYDPAADSWERINDFPGLPRMGAFSAVVGGSVYIGTGYDFLQNYNDLYKYDSYNDAWYLVYENPAEFAQRRAAVSFVIDSMIYIAAGYSTMALSDVWAFNPVQATYIPLGVNEMKTNALKTYPNPATGYFSADLSTVPGKKQITLTDVNGIVIKSFETDGSSIKVDVSDIKAGICFLTIISERETLNSKIVIK